MFKERLSKRIESLRFPQAYKLANIFLRLHCSEHRPVTLGMDEHTVPIGIPCMASQQPSSHRYFFVTIYSSEEAAGRADVPLQVHPMRVPKPLPIKDLERGPLLAKGPNGSTYRGFYKGEAVAVKVANYPHQLSHYSVSMMNDLTKSDTHTPLLFENFSSVLQLADVANEVV